MIIKNIFFTQILVLSQFIEKTKPKRSKIILNDAPTLFRNFHSEISTPLYLLQVNLTTLQLSKGAKVKCPFCLCVSVLPVSPWPLSTCSHLRVMGLTRYNLHSS